MFFLFRLAFSLLAPPSKLDDLRPNLKSLLATFWLLLPLLIALQALLLPFWDQVPAPEFHTVGGPRPVRSAVNFLPVLVVVFPKLLAGLLFYFSAFLSDSGAAVQERFEEDFGEGISRNPWLMLSALWLAFVVQGVALVWIGMGSGSRIGEMLGALAGLGACTLFARLLQNSLEPAPWSRPGDGRVPVAPASAPAPAQPSKRSARTHAGRNGPPPVTVRWANPTAVAPVRFRMAGRLTMAGADFPVCMMPIFRPGQLIICNFRADQGDSRIYQEEGPHVEIGVGAARLMEAFRIDETVSLDGGQTDRLFGSIEMLTGRQCAEDGVSHNRRYILRLNLHVSSTLASTRFQFQGTTGPGDAPHQDRTGDAPLDFSLWFEVPDDCLDVVMPDAPVREAFLLKIGQARRAAGFARPR